MAKVKKVKKTRCAAITVAGKKCKNSAAGKSKYCASHKKKQQFHYENSVAGSIFKGFYLLELVLHEVNFSFLILYNIFCKKNCFLLQRNFWVAYFTKNFSLRIQYIRTLETVHKLGFSSANKLLLRLYRQRKIEG